MSKMVDLELKKAFVELQSKMVDTTQKLKMADIQIDGLKRSMQHALLTDKEISKLDTGVPTYESVGRMFVRQDISTVRANLTTKVNGCGEKVKALESNKAYLERNLKDSENNIREMVQQKKGPATDS